MQKWNVLGEAHSKKDVVSTILFNRGIIGKAAQKEFLHPPKALALLRDFPADFKKSLLEAKKVILEAIEDKIPIIIHGDYDADGICGTAILFNALKHELGYEKVFAFVPNRFEHGYGLSKESIDASLAKLPNHSEGPVLFITVDSGITSREEVDYIKALGHFVIVTDHHQKPDKLPEAEVTVWTDKIVGASISWILSKTLGSKDSSSIGLASLATVTDVQPVLGINRSIVKEGLEALDTCPPLGIKKLLEICGRKKEKLTTYDLGWVLGPRINAAGRVEDASDSLLLLLEKDEKAAADLAWKLNKINVERQDETTRMYDMIDSKVVAGTPKIMISSHENYHEGIIGLVASRLVKKYYRPSVVISLGKDFGKGSVRSIPGVDIIAILRRFEDLFVNLGGHPMAAGFTIHKDNIALLEENLVRLFEEEFLDEELFQPVLDIDLKIPAGLVDEGLWGEVDRLKPFGVENREPLFLSNCLVVGNVSVVGRDGTHLSLKLFDGEKTHKAIFFGAALDFADLKVGDVVDVVYFLRENNFNGRSSVDLVVKDLREAGVLS